jgi:hypothetical protein
MRLYSVAVVIRFSDEKKTQYRSLKINLETDVTFAADLIHTL